MKRMISVFLVLAMVLSLCACNRKKTAAQPEVPAFQAGFGRVNITPNYAVPLEGNRTIRMSQGFQNYLYTICVALRDAQGKTALLLVNDLAMTYSILVEKHTQAISQATGVPEENIYIAATHTHSGPAVTSSNKSAEPYRPFLQESMVQAAVAAMEDLAPAQIQTGSTEAKGLTFVRHYLMNDGTYSGDNFGKIYSGYKAHEREADEEMQLVRLVRSGKKQDILLVNWQSHPTVASTSATPEGKANQEMLSADYVGFLRDFVVAQPQCQVAFFQGAGGNLNPRSSIVSEQTNVPQDAREYGNRLGEYAIQALATLKPVQAGPLLSQRTLYSAQIDHTEEHLLSSAKIVADLWNTTHDFDLCVRKGEYMGITNPYQATSIVRRAAMTEESEELQINALAIGQIAFVTVPYEMFCQNGQAIKNGANYETTFVITCCNGHYNYMAADAAFEYGAYEAHNRTFVRGTAEAVQEELIAMLKTLNGQ